MTAWNGQKITWIDEDRGTGSFSHETDLSISVGWMIEDRTVLRN